MNYDEFAFFNQQLAAMLKSGIPLEGALHELATDMRNGRLRNELLALQADLERGVPLQAALADRKLPSAYIRMVQAGVQSNDLPGTLTLVADHYQRLSLLFARLSGLMVYPALVLAAALVLSLFLTFLHMRSTFGMWNIFSGIGMPLRWEPSMSILLPWLPPITILLFTICVLLVIASQRTRQRLKWRIPAFRDAYLAQLASTGEIMLRRGHTLPDTVQFLSELERDTPAQSSLQAWQAALAEGRTEIPKTKSALPPLFFWLLKSAGEDLPNGFRRASEIYQRRAAHRLDMLLFAALPVSIIVLGVMLFVQVYPSILMMLNLFNLLDSGFGE